jgi:DNA gyrase/topoisomerase IV subunit B
MCAQARRDRTCTQGTDRDPDTLHLMRLLLSFFLLYLPGRQFQGYLALAVEQL